jgi:hypothetical protein
LGCAKCYNNKAGGAVKNNYVLIDYENVQPKDLAVLNGHPFKIMVFVGANQEKIPFSMASALQSLGSKAEYVKISGNGNNALDFHIAFYIGQIAAQDPDAYFHIVSKDAGFDPLIKHLKQKKIFAQRERDVAEIPLIRISNTTSVEDKIDAIVKNLAARGPSRPRKIATLANTINAMFMKTLAEADVNAIIAQMQKQGLVGIADQKVSYHPPISSP